MKKCALLIGLFLSGCTSPDTSWFPLSEGYWWQYSAIRSIKGEDHIQKLILASLPSVTVEGKTLFPRKRADGQLEYYEKSDSGVYRINLDDGARDFLLPDSPQPGMKWKGKSKILFLEVTGAFEATYNERIKEEINMEYEVVSVNEVIKVPAGSFENCVRVRGFGSLYGGGGTLEEFLDIDDINIETLDWYAPGVGLIKRTRKEYTHPLAFENQYSEELEFVKKG